MKWIGYVLYGIYLTCTLWLVLSAIVQLHLLWHARRRREVPTSRDFLPRVTIQVPVYNEKFVIEGLLDSLAQLTYPKHLFFVQVLDDSTDDTSNIIDRKADQLRKEGIQVEVLRRPARTGYKAGALQYGLSKTDDELIAIFDADFRPSADYLDKLVGHFADEKVGLVQSRWSHINYEQNALTRIQAILLDTHFMVEQQGRFNADYFTSFCGTAGIWRKQCIEDAGGWDGSVLSEDLDLSYRAQLKGWKLVYEGSVQVPSEIPALAEAFKVQQFRWTKGMAQCAVKLVKLVLQSSASTAKKVHAFFHLTGSLVFVCILINSLLTVPLLLFRHLYVDFVFLVNLTAIGAINVVALSITSFHSAPKSISRWRFVGDYLLFVVVYMAMAVQNAIAVLEGLASKRSGFVRTPKFAGNEKKANNYAAKKINRFTLAECGMLLYLLAGIVVSIVLQDYFLIGFFFMMSTGLVILLYQTLPAISITRLKIGSLHPIPKQISTS